ncbi:DUF433 domain-containing protein [Pararhizobium sp. LjRoot238]|uniref:DUF433 domain-containing protein n=1 Tax=Pararhizobium sp. LjRoot238 TaxID=3342293 RepID=UPI003ED04386
MSVAEMLKTTEAAVVSHVALRDVNRVIDEGILPEAFFSVDNGRHVLAAACTLISFYFESAERLTSEERLNTIRWAEPRLSEWRALNFSSLVKIDWTMHHDFLAIDLAPFVRKMVERLASLEAARAMVVSSPDILGGTPVIRGTRIPVHDVAASVTAGYSLEDILEAYPVLYAKQVELATVYADANPPRGRPRPVTELPIGATIITDRRVPRRRKAV